MLQVSRPPDAVQWARRWVDDFNHHDVERVLSHYREDVRLTSPRYLAYTGGLTATAVGRDALRSYFGYAFAKHPTLTFTLLEILVGVGSLCVRYRTSIGDQIAAECMAFDDEGRVYRADCHYLDGRD